MPTETASPRNHIVGGYRALAAIAFAPSDAAHTLRRLQHDLLACADTLAELSYVGLESSTERAFDCDTARLALGGIGCLIQLACAAGEEAAAKEAGGVA
jgi:hypothetical protein